MILVTSANGKLGSDVVAAIRKIGLPVRAFVRPGRAIKGELLGAEILEGDLFDRNMVFRATRGVEAIFHISPPHHAGEFALGQLVIDAANAAGVRRVVYLSAIHPMLSALPGHRMKSLVEEYLVDAGLEYTILQPTMFMQNTDLQRAMVSGVLGVPYSPFMPMSFVDRLDVAEISAKVLQEPGHLRATYPLIGTEPTTFSEMAGILAQLSGNIVQAKQVPLEVVLFAFPRDTAEQRYTADTFERMFSYYNRHGLTGNSNVLRWLLGREPTDLRSYLSRSLEQTGRE